MKEVKKLKFNELALSPEMEHAITDMGFIEASPIQSQTIPQLLERKDVIGQAQTGTGKTAAFGIPLLELISPEDKFVSSLVVCPTRELAQQVAMELKKLAKYKKHIHILAIYGGDSMQNQIHDLKRGMNVIVGTPGRIMDHLQRKTLSFEKVKMVVLDEADNMLDMGFREDIESILKKMPPERQTVLFSATMPKPILDIAHKFQKSPVHVKVTTENLTATSIEQIYFEVGHASRTKIVSTLMDVHDLKLVLLFCNTKRKVDEVVSMMRTLGHKADAIHGDLSQSQRNSVLASFKSGRINILVASDVAARGIDVSNVDAVFNYDIPVDAEYYVHRIGRTGRAGKTGKAFSFVTGRNDQYRLRDIERYAKVRIERRNIPTEKEVLELNNVKLLTKLKTMLAEGHLDKFESMANDYCKEGFTLEQLAAVLLKLTLKGTDKVSHEPRRPDSGSDSRHSFSREKQSHSRPSYSPMERYERPGGHSGGRDHKRTENHFSKERSERAPSERSENRSGGEGQHFKFRKRRPR
jgi:ATP-dependent RNA helicase DeaD